MPADISSRIFSALVNAWGLIVQLAPYVGIGIVTASLLAAFGTRNIVPSFMRNSGWWNLPLMAVAGMVSPACTLGTVPLFMEMLRCQADLAPIATFLVASTILNPQMFFLVFGALGAEFAIAQASCAFIFAVLVGLSVKLANRLGTDTDILTSGFDWSSRDDFSRTRKHIFTGGRRRWIQFCRSVLELTEFVGFYFLLGSIIAALVSEFVPSSLMIAALGQHRWWAIPLAAVASVPIYVCGGAMIPFFSVAHNMGMSTGAILSVLIAGPATRITALSALAVIFRKRALVIYVLGVLIYAMLVGMLFKAPLAAKAVLSP
ncbi:MAG: permease [Armatimonadota bacterium]